MRTRLRRKMIFAIALMLPFMTFAQETFVQQAKGVINEYLIPLILIGVIAAGGVGLLFNLDDFVDKKGDGTRSKALVNIGWIMGIAFIGILAFIGLINWIARQQVQIN